MFILRGLPGTGKSTYARHLHEQKSKGTKRVVVVSADDLFVDKHGVYAFTPTRLGEAHAWCMERAIRALGTATIVIDNTNCARWEYSHYVALAEYAGYLVRIMAMHSNPRAWPITAIDRLTRINTHGVPLATIHAMAQCWQGAGADETNLNLWDPDKEET